MDTGLQQQNAQKAGRLGRGLAALLGDEPEQEVSAIERARRFRRVMITQISSNQQNPRIEFDSDELADLAQSIREKGIVQPILVRMVPGETEKYEIVAGERRWRAAQQLGLHEVPVNICEVTDAEALEIAIIENVQRSDLNPIEEASGYAKLIELYNYTQEDVARIIGKSRSHVANCLRLLKLPASVVQMINRRELSAGHARTLINQSDPEAVAKRIVSEGMNVRQAEEINESPQAKKRKNVKKSIIKDANIVNLEAELSKVLGMKVFIQFKEGKGGEIKVMYKSLEQLEDICHRLRGNN